MLQEVQLSQTLEKGASTTHAIQQQSHQEWEEG
jgi:hypothetical protein